VWSRNCLPSLVFSGVRKYPWSFVTQILRNVTVVFSNPYTYVRCFESAIIMALSHSSHHGPRQSFVYSFLKKWWTESDFKAPNRPLNPQYKGVKDWLTRTNSHFIFFGLTRHGFEHTIYHIKGKHANHYTTDDRTHNLPHKRQAR
jgi:hypothetical protein